MSTKLITKFRQSNRNEDVPSDCRSITFIKQSGSAPCSVNDFPLVDDQPFSINNDPGEIETTIFRLVFGAGSKLVFTFRQYEV